MFSNPYYQHKERDDYYTSVFVLVIGLIFYTIFYLITDVDNPSRGFIRGHGLLYFFSLGCHTLAKMSEYDSVIRRNSYFSEEYSGDIAHAFQSITLLLFFLGIIAWMLSLGFMFITRCPLNIYSCLTEQSSSVRQHPHLLLLAPFFTFLNIHPCLNIIQ